MSDAPQAPLAASESSRQTDPPEVVNAPLPQTPLQSGVEKLASRGTSSLVEMMAMTASMSGNPLHQKMNAEHITQVLKLAEKHDEREYNLSTRQQDKDESAAKWDRVMHAIYFGIVVGVLIFVTWIFKAQPTVLAPILSGVGGGFAGFLGGVGYARKSQSK